MPRIPAVYYRIALTLVFLVALGIVALPAPKKPSVDLLGGALAAGVVADYAPSPVPPPLPPEGVVAKSYLVKIIGEEQALIEHNADEPLPPASVTKLLTALIAMEELAPETTIPFSVEAKNIGEKVSPVKAHEVLSRDAAVALALIGSANDAAVALAEAVGRKHDAQSFADAIQIFVSLMNEKAHALGVTGSHFKNPTGLDEDGHLVSTRDFARIAETTMREHADLFVISTMREAAVTTLNGHHYTLKNTNELLDEFPKIAGSKTGFTDKARGALLLIYPLAMDKNAVIVIMGSENRFGDGRILIHWLENQK